MKIEKVTIQNFRTLRHVELTFEEITTLIGANGSGKSTVLRALDWFFNGGPKGQLTLEDYCDGDKGNLIRVEVVFGSLTPEDRAALGKYTPVGSTNFIAWKTKNDDGTEVLSANAKAYPPFTTIRNIKGVPDKRKEYTVFAKANPDLGLPSVANGDELQQAMTLFETNNPNLLTDTPDELQTDFFGFNGEGTMSKLFNFVFVSADLRATEETEDSKTSVIGKILERMVDRKAADKEISEIVEDSQKRQKEAYERLFRPQLNDLSKELNELLTQYTTGRDVNLDISDSELKVAATKFEVSVTDGINTTKIERQGHGFQRTVILSALQLLAVKGSPESLGQICLAIEEPELFQHPVQARAFAKVLRALASDPTKKMQVLYATHSPYFLEAEHFSQIRCLTRGTNPRTEVVPRCTDVTSICTHLLGFSKTDQVKSQLDMVLTTNINEAVFASKALLVEGSTDVAVLSGIADRIQPGKLESRGITLVAVGGKTSLFIPHAILSFLGVEAFIAFDGDKGAEQRAQKEGKDVQKVKNIVAQNIVENRNVLKYCGLPETDFPPTTFSNKTMVMEDNIEVYLEGQWPEFELELVRLELATGISRKKNSKLYYRAALGATGTPPQIFIELINALLN